MVTAVVVHTRFPLYDTITGAATECYQKEVVSGPQPVSRTITLDALFLGHLWYTHIDLLLLGVFPIFSSLAMRKSVITINKAKPKGKERSTVFENHSKSLIL